MRGYPAKLNTNTSTYDTLDQVFYFINYIPSHFAGGSSGCGFRSRFGQTGGSSSVVRASGFKSEGLGFGPLVGQKDGGVGFFLRKRARAYVRVCVCVCVCVCVRVCACMCV